MDQTLLGTPKTNPCLALANDYLELVLAGSRHRASASILEAVERGVSIREVYLHVFQPVQHEIGRLWQLNRISVAQEHLCTAITQLVMSQLYPRTFSGARNGRSLVATCVGGELHELGVRMVADFLELEGWDTYYLGSNTPHDAVVQQMIDVGAELLAVSVTMPFHLDRAARLIHTVRGDARCAAGKILVGGLPFNLAPDLCHRVQADGTARNAKLAVDAAAQLVGLTPVKPGG
jgi:methanogenic corrinoid protein MtbC1